MLSKKLFLTSTALFVLLSFLFVSSVGASLELWNRTYGGTGGEVAYSLVETYDGGFALAGVSSSDGFWLVKTDADGYMQWNKTYGGGTAHSLIQTSDGGYALAGEIIPSGAAQDFYVVKTDADGNMQWSRTYGGEHSDIAYSLVETSDGGYALAGGTSSFDVGQGDFWLVKTDDYGNVEWNQTYGGASNEGAYSLVETSDRGYALAGYTLSFGAGSYDFWLIKTDSQGIPEFPSWVILPLFLLIVLFAVFLKRRICYRSAT